jgi:hypothetical protein
LPIGSDAGPAQPRKSGGLFGLFGAKRDPDD